MTTEKTNLERAIENLVPKKARRGTYEEYNSLKQTALYCYNLTYKELDTFAYELAKKLKI